MFVGLKDVHPPVDVAAAFQEVVSAQEEKDQTIDLARASRARILPDVKARQPDPDEEEANNKTASPQRKARPLDSRRSLRLIVRIVASFVFG